ncbi:oligoendopeptidase F [Falsibacillus albus]|uniref:Oligopeptidase F n=1 Tax=Falsibacillus albus TaxID=2478915 RepID=A0A3L7JZ92_9BACI|nr:oligoendopeptidase F [Falsibacillus albus]RLQ95449.1 oligoendopeptidase F [Falsibacillus albus]
MEKTKQTRLNRSDVPLEQTWDLGDLFECNEDWSLEMESIPSDLASVTQYKGKLHLGADVLLKCLMAQEQIWKRLVKVVTYSNLRQAEDGTNPENQANSARVATLMSQVNAELSFASSEIISLPDGTIERYLKEEKELWPFKILLEEILDEKPHMLSPETEEALAALGHVHEAPYSIYQLGKLSDMQFDSIKDKNGNELPNSFSLYEDRYELSPDTELRRKAYASFTKTLKQYQNTFAATYATEVNKQVTLAKLRGYESAEHMLLKPQKVTMEMYHNQLDTILNELSPHMQRFALLKKEVLGLDTMKFCDLKAPLDPEFNPKTTYEEASEMILKSLEVMGPEYSAIMAKALSDRWIDISDNVGKSTGAFCSSPYDVHPYILITWTDTMRGAFVLAHELGHAGHFYLANKEQRLFNTRPSTYFVEAPSTMNEMLLSQHMLDETNDTRMENWIITQLLGTYYHNFVTHLLEGEFQRRIYRLAEEGKSLTAKVLCEQKADVLSSFWGDTVEIDEGASMTWMRQPHYYMGLYSYTYSAGLTASTAAAQLIKEEGQPAVDRWLDVLRAGGTKSPLELMKHAGVDMTSPQPIKKAVSYVGSLIDQLENNYH